MPRAIDPYGCGCTECLTGEYIPLDAADAKDMRLMLAGVLRDHTSEQFTLYNGLLTANYCGRSWRLFAAT